MRNIRVKKNNGYMVLFDEINENNGEEKGVWLEFKFMFPEAKDCAGLFALMVAFCDHEDTEKE